jgi:hypothetical protein
VKRFLAAGACLALVALMLPGATGPVLGATYNDVYICTYVGTPGVDQSLTGIGPLGTLTNATPGTWFQYPAGNTVGSLAYVVATIEVPPQPQPPLSDCPAPSNSSTNATIHFWKTVDHTFGGTSTPADWTMTLTPCSTIDPMAGCQFPTGHDGDVLQVAPGLYHLDEAPDPSVTDPTQSQMGGCFKDLATASGFAQDITFAAGETWYCGFVNQVQPATVLFSNTYVGTPPAVAVTMHMTSGSTVYTGTDGNLVDMTPGTYTVSEDLPAGYTAGAGSCTDLFGSGGTVGPTITITNGDSWQCGFTNTYGTHFGVSGFPSPTVAGASHNVTVTALDASNNTDPTYTGTVHFTSTDGAAVLPADATLINGTGTFAVTLATEGTQAITATDTVTSSISGSQTGITVASPPTIIKAFGAALIPVNGSTSLSFTIQNNNTTTALTGVAFTDTLPAGLVISTPNALTGTCGGGTITATQATNVVSLAGASLAQSGSCVFSVNVTGIATGTQVNTTSNVTSTEGGTGGTASASVTIDKADQTITFPVLAGAGSTKRPPFPPRRSTRPSRSPTRRLRPPARSRAAASSPCYTPVTARSTPTRPATGHTTRRPG